MGISRGPDDLDADERARIRYQVLSHLRAHPPTLADRVYDAFALLALPAPHIVRTFVAGAALIGVVAGATVASADSLPSDALYGLKIASEQVRLALALSPTDRAAVELSLAEHRLDEAARLALDGREIEAVVATTAYGQHLASAAAALAGIEDDATSAAVVERLRGRVAAQQQRASGVAEQLPDEPDRPAAPAFRTVAAAASLATGDAALPIAAQIAEHAAQVTDRVAKEAERVAPVRSAAAEHAPSQRATLTEKPSATHAAVPAPAATARPTIDPQAARDAAEKARRDADKARQAADKARDAAKKEPPARR